MSEPSKSGHWYEPVNPDEHCYTLGYGFASRPPFLVEQRLIAGYSAAAAFCLLGYLFLSSFLPQALLQITYYFLPISTPYAVEQLLWQCYVLIGSAVSLLVPFWLFTCYTRIPRESAVPFRRVDWRIMLCVVLAALGVSVIGNYANSAVHSLFSEVGVEFFSNVEIPETTPAYLVFVLNMTLAPAIFEELAFRGMLMQSLRRFGDSFALIVSALLFSIVHIVPTNMPNAFLMGLVIGYFVLFTGSLSAGIVIHLIYNSMVVATGLFEMLPSEALRISYHALDLVCLLVGLLALIELLRRYPSLFALRMSRTINPSEQKLRVFLCSLPMFLFYIVMVFEALRFRI